MRFKGFIIKNYSQGNTFIRKEERKEKGKRDERDEEIFFLWLRIFWF